VPDRITVFIETNIVKQSLGEIVKGNTLEKTRGDDAISIDISAGDVDCGAADLFDR
tara:strand:+ start:25586 stop:25753 length:168 start_codon:yes stop_codon:yes gene_type:complete